MVVYSKVCLVPDEQEEIHSVSGHVSCASRQSLIYKIKATGKKLLTVSVSSSSHMQALFKHFDSSQGQNTVGAAWDFSVCIV